MKYKIVIEETVSEVFEVEAADIEEAMDIATEKYYDGEFVLAPGSLVTKQMCAEEVDGDDCVDWIEF